MRRVTLLVVLAVVVLWPAFQREPADGFPVSSYPMFARRSGTVVSIATAVGVDAAGGVHRLGTRALGGGDEVVLAAEQARRAVEEGAESSAAFCAEIAGRVDDRDLVRIEVRTEVRDAVADVGADHEPIEIVIHARCEVATT